MCMTIELINDRALIVFDLIPTFTIPDEKIILMTESVNLINKDLKFGCIYIDRENKRVKFHEGIMIDNDTLNKKEFTIFFQLMMSAGCFFFPMIKEQLSSNESLKTVMAKSYKPVKDCHQQSK